MISGDANRVEELDRLIERPDLGALEAWLIGADTNGMDRAVSWVKRRRDQIQEFRRDEPYETGADRRWIPNVIAAAALTPADAVKSLPWNDFWFVLPHQVELLDRTLLRRPVEWARRFVPAAARVRLGSRREPATAPFLFSILDALIREHGLEVPDGDAFLDGWARSRTDLTDPLYMGPLLPRLLRSPHLRHRPDVLDVVPQLRADRVSRADLVGALLDALTSPSTPASQRVLAKLWRSVAPELDELNGRLPLLLSALATSHGSLTEPVLPVAVSLAGSATDLDEIARVITERPEKRQQTLLLRLLETPQLRQRLGGAAVSDAVTRYETVDDASLRDRAARLARRLGNASEVARESENTGGSARFDGLWSPLPRERRVPLPLEVPGRISRSLIQQLLGNQWSRPFVAVRHGEINRVGEAVLLECLVRASSGARAESIRAWLPSSDEPIWHGLQPVASAIICWLRGDFERSTLYDTRIPGNFVGDVEPRWRGIAELVNAAAREVLSQTGELRTVLSTPSHDDGTVVLDALVERIASGAVTSYTPHDLALALFRLPPDSGNTRALTGLRLPADPDIWREHVEGKAVDAPDGIELLALWLEAGGLSPRESKYRFEVLPSGRTAWLWDTEDPPYPGKVIDLLRIDHTRLFRAVSLPDAVVMAPGWPDLSATGDNWRWTNAGVLIEGPGPLCAPSHAVLLTMMAGDNEERTMAATRLLRLVSTERLSEGHLREAAEVLNRAGLLPLSRFAQVVEQAFSSGGLADLWAPTLGVAEDAALRQPRPSGLPELLRTLTAYAPAVPDPELPMGLVDLATSRGASKSQAEARALVRACGLLEDHSA